MLAEFSSWWLGQMRSLIPGKWSGTGRQPDALIVVIDDLGIGAGRHGAAAGSIRLRRGGLESVLQPLNLDRPTAAPELHLPIGLRLPEGAVLDREAVLPLAAARDLQSVIGFEIDRLTPFAADEVYWGIGGITPDRARGNLSVRLYVVLRAPVDSLRQALARSRIIPSFIEAPGGRIELATAHPRAKRLARNALMALCAVLALACLATPFIRQQIALDAASRIIAERRAAAQTAMALRQQLATAASGRNAIAQARSAGDALQVLAALTAALPDGTWLSDLTLNAGDLRFDGESNDAARLIGLLSNVPALQDPSFTAPVTRTADGKADEFSMHATVGQ